MHSFQRELNNNQGELFTKKPHGTACQSKDAKFIAWQPMQSGEIVALFNITNRKHPSLWIDCYSGHPSQSAPSSSSNTSQTAFILRSLSEFATTLTRLKIED